MRFLETITGMGDSLLIPIDRIKFICIKYVTGWEIKIASDEEGESIECFGKDEDKATKRYEQIKKIINYVDKPNKKLSAK